MKEDIDVAETEKPNLQGAHQNWYGYDNDI